ncbi:MAG: cysteine-rich repeat protein, partial [Hyphomicrobiaceae bacterium]
MYVSGGSMKFRSVFLLAALLSFVCQPPVVAQAQTDKEALLGQPVLYKGELIGGWSDTQPRAEAIPSAVGSTSLPLGSTTTMPAWSSTTIPPDDATFRRTPSTSTTTTAPPVCQIGAESGDPTNLLFPLDGSFVPVPFSADGGSGHRPASGTTENNDDDSYLITDLPFEFDFCGTDTNQISINNNGNLTLTDRFSPFTPTGFPIPVSAAKVPMLAPFWADVDSGDDTCPVGDVWMRQTDDTLVVTWDNVGYFDRRGGHRNTFQIAISDGTNPEMGLGNTVCLSYDEMEWTSGEASGGDSDGLNGAPANVGGSFGDGTGFFQIGEFDNAIDDPDYDGPFSTTDNVNFLDGFRTCFCLCDPILGDGNVPPIPLFKAPEDCSVTVDTTLAEAVNLDLNFISPEDGQVTTVSVSDDDGTGALGLVFANTSGNPALAELDWTPVIADVGVYDLVLHAEDDFMPVAGTKDVPCQITVVTSCGNGTTAGNEECDDSNRTSGDGCDENCIIEFCGDTDINNVDEECDDGNTANGDGCDDDCDLEVCGNGETQSGEECDDGNTADGDSCNADCTINVCPDGVTFIGVEECDDGNTVDTDACTNSCTIAVCGDNSLQSGVEECDDGGTANGDGCDDDCDLEVCGNGETQFGEECDDSNTADGDGCDSDCDLEICGNGETQFGEECDDSNTANGDGCDDDCDLEVCGNGETQSGEECDDGNTADGDVCNGDCTLNVCGDMVVLVGTEECDDANTNDNDGCKNDCTLNICPDGVVYTGTEECDDGNTVDTDACLSNCMDAECGDGFVFLCLEPEPNGILKVGSDAVEEAIEDDTRVRIANDERGTWISVWQSTVEGGDLEIAYAVSSDDGLSWADSDVLNLNAGMDGTAEDERPSIATDRNGTWVVAWHTNYNPGGVGSDADIAYAISTDDGATWSAPAFLNSNADGADGNDKFPFVVSDGSLFVVAWMTTQFGGDGDIAYSTSSDGGATWSAASGLNTSSGTDTGVDAAVNISVEDGQWVAVWQSKETFGGMFSTDFDIFTA